MLLVNSMSPKTAESKQTSKISMIKTSLWSKINLLFQDFFDFIIGDYLKGIFGETALDFDVITTLTEVRTVYLHFWREMLEGKTEDLQDPKMIQNIQQMISEFLSASLKLPFFLQEMVINSISNMSAELANIVQFKDSEVILNQRYMQYLEHLIEEYVLVNYFDHFILAGTFKILLSSEHLSFAQIYEMRVNLLEMFREFLFATKKYNEFLLFFENLRLNFKLSYSIDIIENLILSFLICLANNKNNWHDILEYCKRSLQKRSKLIKNYLQIPVEDTHQIIKKWLEDQIQALFANDIYIKPNKQKGLLEKIIVIYDELISQKATLTHTQQTIKDFFTVLYGSDYHKKNRFTATNTQKMLISLATLIDSEVKLDPSLENFAGLIVKLQQESLPGGDEFYI
ncbi:hypothetical protein WKT22_02130 [Candidatus Lokiarchaeum ossiferum]